jgi:serine/threonine protein kinase HipA of HipAB toxin-antitoxin module
MLDTNPRSLRTIQKNRKILLSSSISAITLAPEGAETMEENSLCLAAAQGDIREVQRLLKMGVDIDAAVPPPPQKRLFLF